MGRLHLWGSRGVTGDVETEGEVWVEGGLRFCVASCVGILLLELTADDTKGIGDVLEHLQVLPS